MPYAFHVSWTLQEAQLIQRAATEEYKRLQARVIAASDYDGEEYDWKETEQAQEELKVLRKVFERDFM